jgi:hypothetical protein
MTEDSDEADEDAFFPALARLCSSRMIGKACLEIQGRGLRSGQLSQHWASNFNIVRLAPSLLNAEHVLAAAETPNIKRGAVIAIQNPHTARASHRASFLCEAHALSCPENIIHNGARP